MAEPVEPQPGPSGGLSGALSQLAGTLLALIQARLELVTVEFEEERERTKQLLALIVVAAVFLSFALIALTVLIVVLFWNSYPIAAMIGVTLFYVVVGGGALIALRSRTRGRPFDASLSELEKDAAWLRGRR
jgi:uncharacterized membrane protein YqjE